MTQSSFISTYIISQKRPQKKTTSSPTSPPTSSPTSSPSSKSPVPASSGGIHFIPTPIGMCTLNNPIGANGCTNEVPYCMLINNKTVFSACTGLNSDCVKTSNANGQYCMDAFTQSGYACAKCSLNDTGSFGCKGIQTCGTPSCIADMTEYCSEHHDIDWGCPTPTSARNCQEKVFKWVIFVLVLEHPVWIVIRNEHFACFTCKIKRKLLGQIVSIFHVGRPSSRCTCV